MPTAKIKVNGVFYTIGGLSIGDRQSIVNESQQYANELFNGMSDEIADLRQSVSDTDAYIDGAFKDGIISEAEAKAIATHLKTMETRKAELDREYTDLLANQYLNETSEASLTSAKENYDEKYVALVNEINNAIADSLASESEAALVDQAFLDYNLAISLLVASLKSATEQVAQIRAGSSLQESMDYTDGKIAPVQESLVEAWSEIDQTPLKISAALSKTTIETEVGTIHDQSLADAKAYADVIRASTNDVIANLRAKLTNLNTYVTNSFADGTITSLESSTIPGYVTELTNAKSSLDSDYNSVYNSAYLPEIKRSDLQFARSGVTTAHTNLVNAINSATADTSATADEVTSVNTKFQQYSDAISTYEVRVIASILVIENEKAFELEGLATDGEGSILIPMSSKINIMNSKIEQTAESITSKVSKEVVDADIADNLDASKQYADGLKASTDQSVQELQNSITEADEFINGAFRDGIIYEAEYKKIQAYLLALDESKKTFDGRYNEIYMNVWLTGTPKTDLSTAKTNYDTQYADLVQTINTVIADQLADASENALVNEAFDDYNNSIVLLSTMLERAIDAIAQAKADSARDQAKEYADNLKEEIEGQLTALNNDIQATDEYIDNAFRDGVISEAESKRIKTYINILNESKAVFDQRYDEIYNDILLAGSTYQTELGIRKGMYDTAYNNLISSINNAIVDSIATPAEVADVDSKFSAYNTAAKDLTSAIEKAINFIAQAKANQAQANAEGYTDDAIAPIDGRLSEAESTITQLADEINLRVTSATFNDTVTPLREDIDANKGQIDIMESRISDAELKITPESITSTVTTHEDFKFILSGYASTEDLGTKADQTSLDEAVTDLNAEIAAQIAAIPFDDYAKTTYVDQQADNVTTKIESGGGINLLQNSVGWAEFANWVGWVAARLKVVDVDYLGFGKGFEFIPHASLDKEMSQSRDVIVGVPYTLSWHINKRNNTANADDGAFWVQIQEGGVTTDFIKYDSTTVTDGWKKPTTSNYSDFITFTPQSSNITVRLYGNFASDVTVTGLMLNIGVVPLQWTMATGELYNTNIRMDLNGIRVESYANGTAKSTTVMTPEKFAGYYDTNGDGIVDTSTGSVDEVFVMDGEAFVMKNAIVKETISMGSIKATYVNSGGRTGWAFSPNN